MKPPKAKRQRSVLRQTTHDSPSDATLAYDTGGEVAGLTVSTPPSGYDDVIADQAGVESHLPIRGNKHSELKNDTEGTAVLVSGPLLLGVCSLLGKDQLADTARNSPARITTPLINFQLYQTKSEDRSQVSHSSKIAGAGLYSPNTLDTEPIRCFFGAGHNHALALTRSHAIVWPYSAPASSPSPSETFTVIIPETCRDPNGAVPLGVLLFTATGGQPGLLIVIPSTGKVIYWETVSSAASLGLSRQKQNGIQGSISGLLSGEYATDLVNGEPSGIIATFSSGRVAHITIRDSQGKPSVSVNFLRNTAGGGSRGIFGGIKNVLGGGHWRKEVTAVRAGASHQRGQRDVIVATSAGELEVWDTHWNHGNALKKRFDVKDDIAAVIAQGDMKTSGESDLKVIDFAFPIQQSRDDHGFEESEESWRLFLIVGSPQLSEAKTLFVVQVHLSATECRILSSHSVDLHTLPARLNNSKPRLLVPQSGDTAFIVCGQSIIVLSLPSVKETPTSQLLLDSNKLPPPFQDTIHLRSGKDYEILGCGSEDRLDDIACCACIIMVRNFGVIRVTAFPHRRAESDAEEAQVTSKHKLEQGIFYGTMAKNPLNLMGDGGFDFPAAEIEQASLEICGELLRSESKFIPSVAISVEQNLRLRAKALDDLASMLSRKGNPLGRPARWELLWSAEKLAAQRAMWKVAELFRGQDDKSFLCHVIESMSDKFKTRPGPQHDESDPVRQWFLKDSYRMEHVIPWIKNAIKPRRGNSSKQARKLSEQILEASELFLAITETAFRYRDEHAALYGLGEDFLEDGVLTDGYETLPEFWTSRGVGYTETGHLLDWELDSCRAWIQQKASAAEAPDPQVLKKIAENSARHLHVLGQMHRERVRWLSSQDDPKLVDDSVALDQAHVKERKWQLFKLAGIGHLREALSLAENFRDMGALVELIIELQDQVETQSRPDFSTPAHPSENDHDNVGRRISQYFEKFGEPWADAYFSRQISMGHPEALLSMRKYQSSVTRFLRKNPAYSRLSWINDVTGEDDYDAAAVTLEQLALGSENDLWSHHVEVSVAKLSKLASEERIPSQGHRPTLQEDVSRLDDYAEVDAIQETLYAHIRPILEGAIDKKAEAELALEYFGAQISEDRPSLQEILSSALATLVNRQVVGPDDLVDMLTLMGRVQPSEDKDGDLPGTEFYLALRVIHHGRYAQRDPAYLLALRKLIWRRCMIKDDWEAQGKAAEESNGDSDCPAYDTALYRTLCRCLEGEWR